MSHHARSDLIAVRISRQNEKLIREQGISGESLDFVLSRVLAKSRLESKD